MKSNWKAYGRLLLHGLFVFFISLALPYALLQPTQGSEDRLLLGLGGQIVDHPIDKLISASSFVEHGNIKIPDGNPIRHETFPLAIRNEVGQGGIDGLLKHWHRPPPHVLDRIGVALIAPVVIKRKLDVLTDHGDLGSKGIERPLTVKETPNENIKAKNHNKGSNIKRQKHNH